MLFESFKKLTNQLYVDSKGEILQITNVNEYLCAMSVRNKCITVEYLTSKEELIISLEQLQDMVIKHLGDNVDVARVLYSKVVRGNNEDTNIDYDLMLKFTGDSDS